MTTFQNPTDNYLENPASRSPRSMRAQPHLRRQASRPFDAYGTMPTATPLYPTEEMPRYDAGRNAFNSSMQSAHMNGAHFPYDLGAAQTWNPSANNLQSITNNGAGIMGPIGGFGGTGRLKPSRGRAGLPSPWFDQNSSLAPVFTPLDNNNRHGGPVGAQGPRHDSVSEGDDELIPTAIVIKNIPFAVKKEQLVQLMTELGLPLPYAFNYHFDNGVFRGLAFANFTSADETASVINYLNHYELQGRKLRVEYKKMLPLQERERIEREKRERRGQLEEQHRPMAGSQLHTQPSMSSMSSHLPGTSPSPVDQRGMKPDVDMNDKQTLEFYTEIVMFKNDLAREVLIFPPTLEPPHRRIVHTLAHHMGLMHSSRGNGEQRQVHIFRAMPGTNVSPPNPSMTGSFHGDPSRRGLSRAATTDFSESRHNDSSIHNTLRGQSSVGLLGVLDSSTGFGSASNLRAAKSTADLRSWTPSPVPSSASFPTALQTGGARFQQLDGTTNSNTPTLTPTASNPGLGLPRDENFLVNGLGSMSLGTGISSTGSPRRQRSFFSTWEDSQPYPATAPIGSNRAVGSGLDGASQDRMPMRQNRGPATERGSGFRRQNGHHGRGSDEMRGGPPIIVE